MVLMRREGFWVCGAGMWGHWLGWEVGGLGAKAKAKGKCGRPTARRSVRTTGATSERSASSNAVVLLGLGACCGGRRVALRSCEECCCCRDVGEARELEIHTLERTPAWTQGVEYGGGARASAQQGAGNARRLALSVPTTCRPLCSGQRAQRHCAAQTTSRHHCRQHSAQSTPHAAHGKRTAALARHCTPRSTHTRCRSATRPHATLLCDCSPLAVHGRACLGSVGFDHGMQEELAGLVGGADHGAARHVAEAHLLLPEAPPVLELLRRHELGDLRGFGWCRGRRAVPSSTRATSQPLRVVELWRRVRLLHPRHTAGVLPPNRCAVRCTTPQLSRALPRAVTHASCAGPIVVG